jgi:di/tricarboxylate transporter
LYGGVSYGPTCLEKETVISDINITFTILAVVVVLFVWNKLPVELVALGAALALYATGVLELRQSLAGFGEPTVILIASLFVVSEGLDATGTTAWAGQQLMMRSGGGGPRVMIMMMVLVALLTALISVNGAVAALVPMVVILAVQLGRPPSQMMMPLAFAAHAGSQLALTGTPVNVLVSEAANDAGAGRFGFFSYTLLGVPLLIGTIAIVVLFGNRLLPSRHAKNIPSDLSSHARTLHDQYLSDHSVFRLRVTAASSFVGLSGDSLDLSKYPAVVVVGVQHGGDGIPSRTTPIVADDTLIVRGTFGVVERMCAAQHVEFDSDTAPGEAEAYFNREHGLAELVVPPRSAFIGEIVFPGMVTDSGDLVILAIQRKGIDLGPKEVKLAVGDTLLVQGEWTALDANIDADPNVLAVDAPSTVRRQAVPLGLGAKRAIGILTIMVVLLATGVVPSVVASLLAAMAMVLFRVLTPEQAYRGVSWTAVILVGGMIPMSTAIEETGAADKIAHGLVSAVGDSGPYALLAGLFLLTVMMGQLISNTATALILIPVAVSAATELDVSVRPVLMTLTVAAAASFLTPVATPGNMMVMGPGGYKFGDYAKLGLPMVLWYFIVVMGLVPLIWSF